MDASLPLSGYRVIELSLLLNGPMAASVLGRLGAEVIKLERPGVGDPARGNEPVNLNKRSVTADVTTEAGRKVLHDLARNCDVFITNLRPESLKEMGADPDTLAAVNPRLIYAAGTCYGQHGERANDPGQNTTATAVAGLLYLLRDEEGEPREIPGTVSSTLSGTMLAMGVVAALLQRERTGEAPPVHCSMIATNMWYQYLPIARFASTGEEPALMATRRNVANAFNNRYRCADGLWFAFTQATQLDRFWPIICRALEIEHLQHDPRFETADLRREHRHDLVAVLDEVFLRRTAREWDEVFHQFAIQGTSVNDYAHMVEDPEVVANEFITTTASGNRAVALPFTLADRHASLAPIGPLGGDTDEVLARVCGYAPAQIEELRAAGAV
jgi:crotonobetainyl-CoA:carnitine CoA-transferase CaiB-like acyl-CoA transferase